MGTESRRQELMKLCGLCDEALRELETAACAGESREDYEERIGLAAAMKQAGFSAEEIRAYFGGQSRSVRRALLAARRWALVQEIRERETALARVDYLLYQEERNG